MGTSDFVPRTSDPSFLRDFPPARREFLGLPSQEGKEQRLKDLEYDLLDLVLYTFYLDFHMNVRMNFHGFKASRGPPMRS